MQLKHVKSECVFSRQQKKKKCPGKTLQSVPPWLATDQMTGCAAAGFSQGKQPEVPTGENPTWDVQIQILILMLLILLKNK